MHVFKSYHDSESELESENEKFCSSSTSSFYVGRGQTTLWKTSEKQSTKVRIRSYNIISHFPGPKRDRKNITTAGEVYRKCITNKIYVTPINISQGFEEFFLEKGMQKILMMFKFGHLFETPAIFPFKKYGHGTGFEIFRAVMNRERIFFLLRIRYKLQNYVSRPGEYLTVDEKIIPFKGRCSFKQCLPNKPAKYGIKTYVLCCSRTCYVVNLEIYAGK
ncbi:hypothetical protein LAZ67_21001360 [Cordylochernes scorpioides]|uniref:PiggyBac transposable element-derived protein domain-containing protein n=1 Tax=Cordylochernes scorpioides TaxID=51811 RepID=A0ABY6LPJ1_9ARAC|nr:hypothetical protein LAZ67_21001360 [Cordylochernes scorpioides]